MAMEYQQRVDNILRGRIDKHTYTDSMLSPRAAIIYSPTEKDTLKLMWSRSVRANNEEEMKLQAMNGDDTSTPEKVDTLEFRYERQQNKNLDLDASLFLHYNFDLVSWDETTKQSAAVGTQKDCGFELEASYHTEKTRLTLSHGYTKLLAFNLEPGASTYETAKPYGYGNDLDNWSNNITKLTAQQKLDDKWTLNGSFRMYWGFPGTKDYNKYLSHSLSRRRPIHRRRMGKGISRRLLPESRFGIQGEQKPDHRYNRLQPAGYF